MKNKILIVLITLFLTLFLISGTYALFKSGGGANANISAATWSVSVIGNNNDVNVTTGTEGQGYELTVKNDSEVSVVYTITITNLPTGVSVKLDDKAAIEEDNHTVTIDNAGELLISGPRQKVHTLLFSAPLDTEEVTNQTVNISVDFKQKVN